LKYESPDGDISFGLSGYGDFLIYTYLEHINEVPKGTADKKRNTFHKSHTKIKGDWKDNDYSPNNLALRILW
jgi:hypothetical protein